MILPIVTYPDKRLKQKSKPVETFDARLHELLDNMYETMLTKNGVGLASIQVGVPEQILIINIPNEKDEQNIEDLIEAINPEILERGDKTQKSQEGCLSVPEYYDEVERAQYIKVKFQDRHGQEHIIEAHDFLAIAFQHEIDHLNGYLFVEKLSIIRRKKFDKEYKKLLKSKKAS